MIDATFLSFCSCCPAALTCCVKLSNACAYQDLSLCTNLSVYENFAMLNVEHTLVSKPGWRARAQAEAKELLERYFPGNNIDVQKAVEKLTLAERQIVEICKTLMTDNLKVLILDEDVYKRQPPLRRRCRTPS